MTTTPTTGEILKYQDLQMAAEAFLIGDDGVERYAKDALAGALVEGNRRASKFTTTQADKFVKHWVVVEQKANTSTGFSGTLFQCIVADPDTGAVVGEMVMCMRSTEFTFNGAGVGKLTDSSMAEALAIFTARRNNDLLIEKSFVTPEAAKLSATLTTN